MTAHNDTGLPDLLQDEVQTIYHSKILNAAFSVENLYQAAIDCARTVRWKYSVKSFWADSPEAKIYKMHCQIITGTFPSPKRKKIVIHERKTRNAISTSYIGRIPIRSLIDNFIFPKISKSFIYDNVACQKGKGSSFAIERMVQHLTNAVKENGRTNIWILKSDIQHYYASISIEEADKMFAHYYKDKELLAYIHKELAEEYAILNEFTPGSQMTQTVGVGLLSPMDHFIKEQLHTKHYIRYMDDFILIGKTKEELVEKVKAISKFIAPLNLNLHPRKTTIYKLDETRHVDLIGYEFRINRHGEVHKYIAKRSRKEKFRKVRRLCKIYFSNRIPYGGYEPMSALTFLNCMKVNLTYFNVGDSKTSYDNFYKFILKTIMVCSSGSCKFNLVPYIVQSLSKFSSYRLEEP